MFKYTVQEREVIAAIEQSYRQQMELLVAASFKEKYVTDISNGQLEEWMKSIEDVRLLSNARLEEMLQHPTVEEHLGNSIFTLITFGAATLMGFVLDRASTLLPKTLYQFLFAKKSSGKAIGDSIRDAFAAALTPFVVRYIHNSFCNSPHGDQDLNEKDFLKMIGENALFTKLIQQECTAVANELVKLFRFRELLLLGTKAQTPFNFDVREEFLRRLKIDANRQNEANAVIEYYFVLELNRIFKQGFKNLYSAHQQEITSEQDSKILHILRIVFESEEKRQTFTCQIQKEFMQMTIDFLLQKINEPGMLAKHPLFYSLAGGLLVALSVSAILLPALGFSSGLMIFAIISFGLGCLAVNLAKNHLAFFQYKRSPENRRHLREVVENVRDEYLRLSRQTIRTLTDQDTLIKGAQHFADRNKHFHIRNPGVARGSTVSWLREYAALYCDSKQIEINLGGIFETIVTQGREQNEKLLKKLTNIPYRKEKKSKTVDNWIEKTKAYLIKAIHQDDIQKFELIEKIREQILELVSQLNYIPTSINDFYGQPIEEGGLGGNASDLKRGQRFANPDFKHLILSAEEINSHKEPEYISKDQPFFQGYPQYRDMLNLNPGSSCNTLNESTIDHWLERTQAYMLSLCNKIYPGLGVNPLLQPLVYPDEFDEFAVSRMLVLRQFASLCRGPDAHPNAEVRGKIERFVRQFFAADPERIFNNMINSTFFLNLNPSEECLIQNNTLYLMNDLQFLTGLLSVSMAYTGKLNTPMQILHSIMDNYSETAKAYIAFSPQAITLAPQGTYTYRENIKAYCQHTGEFLQKEKMNPVLAANNIFECYRFQVSVHSIHLLLSILNAIVDSKTSKEQKSCLQKALIFLVAFIKKDCYAPEKNTMLERFLNELYSQKDLENLNLHTVKKYLHNKDLREYPEGQLQHSVPKPSVILDEPRVFSFAG